MTIVVGVVMLNLERAISLHIFRACHILGLKIVAGTSSGRGGHDHGFRCHLRSNINQPTATASINPIRSEQPEPSTSEEN